MRSSSPGRSFTDDLTRFLPWIPTLIWGVSTAFFPYYQIVRIFSIPKFWKAVLLAILIFLCVSLVHFLVSHFIRPRLLQNGFSSLAQFLWSIGACLAGIILAWAIPIQAFTLPGRNWFPIIYTTAAGCVIGFGVFIASSLLGTKQYRHALTQKRRTRWEIIYYAFPMILVGVIYLLSFWPGIMSPDSIDQWQQAHDFAYLTDAHPAFHTLTIWAMTRLWDTPAAIAIVQIITMSLVIAIGLHRMRAEGVPAWVTWTIVILFCVIPINGAMLVTIWKDIPYATALLGLTLVFWHIAITGGAWLKYRWSWLWLGIIATFVGLTRHNGLPVALLSLAALAIYFPMSWRKAIFSLVFCSSVMLIVRGPLYKILDVGPSYMSIGVLVSHRIAAHLAYGTPLTPDEVIFLDPIKPTDSDWTYDCYSILETVRNDYAWDIALKNNRRLVEIYLGLTRRNPVVELKHMFCSSSIVWRISQPVNAYSYSVPVFEEQGQMTYIYENNYELVERSYLPAAARTLTRIINLPQLKLIWRPAIYLFLIIFCGVVQAIRLKSLRITLYLMPVLLSSAVLLILSIAQDFRYFYANFLVAILFLGGLFLPLRLPSDGS